MMSEGNDQRKEDEQVGFSTGFDLNIEDLNSNFNNMFLKMLRKQFRWLKKQLKLKVKMFKRQHIRMFRKMLQMNQFSLQLTSRSRSHSFRIFAF